MTRLSQYYKYYNQGDGTAVRESPPWQPSHITGLVMWLDGFDMSTMFQDDAKATPVTATGQNVAVWEDKSPAAGDWAQTNGTYRPIYDTGDRLYFNGDTLYGPNLSALTEGTIFYIVEIKTIVGAADGAIHRIGSASAVGHYAGGDDNRDNFGSTNRSVPNNVWNTGGRPVATVPHVFIVSQKSNEHKAYINNIIIDTTALTTGFNTAPVIGGHSNTQYKIDGWLSEIIMYDTLLSDANRGIVYDYLITKT